jgi:hypothetical protein
MRIRTRRSWSNESTKGAAVATSKADEEYCVVKSYSLPHIGISEVSHSELMMHNITLYTTR